MPKKRGSPQNSADLRDHPLWRNLKRLGDMHGFNTVQWLRARGYFLLALLMIPNDSPHGNKTVFDSRVCQLCILVNEK